MRMMRLNRPAEWSWSPISQLDTLRNEINRIFDGSFADFGRASEAFNIWAPALDLYENADSLVVTAEVPGLKKEDIDISLHEGNLTVAGERKEEKDSGEKNTQRAERFYGRFSRTISLPKPVTSENIKAVYNDGILTVTLPKAPEAKPQQIEVNVS